jgi:hypothetical protein
MKSPRVLLDKQTVGAQNCEKLATTKKGTKMMKRSLTQAVAVSILTASIVLLPTLTHAQQADNREDDGVFVLGSILLSILHVPLKLATCVGTQATAAVAYAATYDVRGNYDGGTNGRDIGETARRSWTGSWFIAPSQLKSDYGS